MRGGECKEEHRAAADDIESLHFFSVLVATNSPVRLKYDFLKGMRDFFEIAIVDFIQKAVELSKPVTSDLAGPSTYTYIENFFHTTLQTYLQCLMSL